VFTNAVNCLLNRLLFRGFVVFAAVFKDVAPCESFKTFRRNVLPPSSRFYVQSTATAFIRQRIPSTLKMEAVCFFETLILARPTLCHIPDDGILWTRINLCIEWQQRRELQQRGFLLFDPASWKASAGIKLRPWFQHHLTLSDRGTHKSTPLGKSSPVLLFHLATKC
jgi:hypothetical protein